MQSKSIRFPAISLITILLMGCSDREPVEPEQQNIRPAKIFRVEASAASDRFEFTGRIEASQSIDLSFEVGGPLAEIAVREGVTVPKGALIAALEPKEFELAVRESGVQLKLAAQDLARKRQVFEQKSIAKSQVEDAQSNYELQKVRLNQAKERLADTRIFAPFEAYVSRRYFDEGVNVRPGDPIVKLHDLNRLLIVMSIPENIVATVSADQLMTSTVQFSFLPNQQFDMTYHENRGEADSLAQTYEVTFMMDNPEQWNILPGMTASAVIELRPSEVDTILVPASALVPMPDDTLSVWVFNTDSMQVTRRTVRTDAPTESGVPILAGLQSGEHIVIAGASQLQEGMKVRPLE